MKKIINSRLYDTETATLIYTDYKGKSSRDYYKTHKGAFFCHYISAGDIQLLDEEEMKNVLANKDVDKYIELFGDVAEG